MASNLQQSQVVLDPEVQAYREALLALAQTKANEGFTIPEYTFADLDPLQQTAYNTAKSGIGNYASALKEAGSLYGDAADIYGGMGQIGSSAADVAAAKEAEARKSALKLTGEAGTTYRGLAGMGQGAVGTTADARTTAQGLLDTSQNLYGGLTGIGADASNILSSGAGTAGGTIGSSKAGFSGLTDYGSQAQNLASAGAQSYDPTSVSSFMDPFQKEVMQNSLAEMRRQSDITKQSLAAQAVKGGAFGGSRFGVQMAEQDRNLAQAQNQKIAELMSAGYTQAQAASMAAFSDQQKRQQQAAETSLGAGDIAAKSAAGLGSLAGQEMANAQAVAQGKLAEAELAKGAASGIAGLSGQGFAMGESEANKQLQAAELAKAGATGIASIAGQNYAMGQGAADTALRGGQLELAGAGAEASGIASLGGQQSALAGQTQALNQNEVSSLENMGATRTALEQAELDANRQELLQQEQSDMGRINFLSDIYNSTPSGQTTVGQQYTAGPTTASQLVGNSIGIYGALSQANKPTTNIYTGYK